MTTNSGNDMSKLYGDIEAKHGLKLPDEFVTLSNRGRFEVEGKSGNWAFLLQNRYLWMLEMEWRSLEEILANNLTEEVKPGFVSFACNGAGDDWCWYPPAAVNGKVPVLSCPHDSDTAEFFAPNFITAVYRQIIFACECGFGAGLFTQGEDIDWERQYLKRWSDEIGPMLPAAAAKTLASLPDLKPQTVTVGRSTQTTLLSTQQAEELIARDVAFPRMGEKIQWMNFD
jgi:hypothetical protein